MSSVELSVECTINEARRRYEAHLGEDVVGIADYNVVDGVVVLPHVEVPPRFGGQGVASALTRFALDDIRAKELAVMPICPFVKAFIAKHPEYADLAV